jgi:putative signal transducing protein
MDDLVAVEVVRTEPEAELLCGLLRGAGIRCMHKVTNMGAGVFEGLPGGPQEVLVRTDDLEAARQVLRKRD